MGGRGSSSGGTVSHNPYSVSSKDYSIANTPQKKYTVDYEPYARGQISKTDAGQVYKAVKNGDVKALPETVSSLYDQAKSYIRFASERYSQDGTYYDRVTNLTRSLLNGDYARAQAIINIIENDSIKRAGKKSRYYKYVSKLK